MSYPIVIDAASAKPKYRQIADALLEGIRSRAIAANQQLPSINEISALYDVSRDTVERAYKVLKRDGVIQSVRGKGYYANLLGESDARRVLVLFNKLSDRKREIYEGLCRGLPPDAEVDIQVYAGNVRTFARLLERHRHRFTDFVIIASFVGGSAAHARDVINEMLAGRSVVLVSDDLGGVRGEFGSVTQCYREDIVSGLGAARERLRRYRGLTLLFDPDSPARGIIEGFVQFADDIGLPGEVDMTDFAPERLARGRVYITVTDQQLVHLVSTAREQGLALGGDIGVIAYNDSSLKRVLAGGVTVITTDHDAMGALAAEMIVTGEASRRRVPFRFIERATL